MLPHLNQLCKACKQKVLSKTHHLHCVLSYFKIIQKCHLRWVHAEVRNWSYRDIFHWQSRIQLRRLSSLHICSEESVWILSLKTKTIVTTRKHSSRMPMTIRALQWTSLNMSGAVRRGPYTRAVVWNLPPKGIIVQWRFQVGQFWTWPRGSLNVDVHYIIETTPSEQMDWQTYMTENINFAIHSWVVKIGWRT